MAVPRLRLPPHLAQRAEGPIPRPRLLGFLAGLVVLLLIIPVSRLVFGGVELGDGPSPMAYLDE